MLPGVVDESEAGGDVVGIAESYESIVGDETGIGEEREPHRNRESEDQYQFEAK